jgi:hypothetical protein
MCELNAMASTDSPATQAALSAAHLEDLKLAASKMLGAKRRAFQAEMAVRYCESSARKAELVFGWGRGAVELGLHEKRTGIVCLSAQSAVAGCKLWEEKHPDVAQALWKLAETHAQQDPTFRTTLSFTRLTAAEALNQLRTQGFSENLLPSPSTMAEVLNRNGFRLRPVLKAKPQKKSQRPTPSSPTSRTRTNRQAKTQR